MAAARPAREPATAATASRTAAIAGPRRRALITSCSRARPRSRKSGAGPSTEASGGAIRARRAPAAAPAAPASGAEHPAQRHVREVVALRDNLGSHQHPGRRRAEGLEYAGGAVLARRHVGVEAEHGAATTGFAGGARRRRQLGLEPLGAGAVARD